MIKKTSMQNFDKFLTSSSTNGKNVDCQNISVITKFSSNFPIEDLIEVANCINNNCNRNFSHQKMLIRSKMIKS